MVDYLRCLARPFSLTFARPFFLTIGRLSSMSCYRSSVLARWKRRLARPFSPRRGVGKADQLTEARVLLSLCPMSGVWTSGRPSRECLHWNIRNIFLSAMDFVRLARSSPPRDRSESWVERRAPLLPAPDCRASSETNSMVETRDLFCSLGERKRLFALFPAPSLLETG